jgi:hypothetical protein
MRHRKAPGVPRQCPLDDQRLRRRRVLSLYEIPTVAEKTSAETAAVSDP